MSLPLVNSLDSSVDALVESSWLHHSEWQPASGVPDPQVVPKTQKAQRRKFSASDKQRILAAVDQATEPGAVGRIASCGAKGTIIHNSASGGSNAARASLPAWRTKRGAPRVPARNRCSRKIANCNARMSGCIRS